MRLLIYYYIYISISSDILNYSLKFKHITQSTAESEYNNLLSNMKQNTYSWITPSWFTDAANIDSQTGASFVFNLNLGESFKTQLLVQPATQKVYSRYLSSGKFTDFAAYDARSLKYVQVSQSSATSKYNNLAENLPNNSYVWVSPSWFTDVPNLYSWSVWVITIGTNSFKEQFAFVPNYRVTYMRQYKSGGYTKWVANKYTLNIGSYYAFGDSTTRGQIGKNWQSGVEYSDKGYPNCISKLLDLNLVNKAVGGQGLLKDWDTINTSIDDLSMSDAKLITIGWAYNDSYGSYIMGTYTDTTTDTVIGRYYTIMKKLQTKCPTAQLVLITGFGFAGGSYENHIKATFNSQFTYQYSFSDGKHTVKELYDELEKMANLHGWPCINQSKGCCFNEFNASTLIGDNIHPTDEGYGVYGNSIANRVISYYVNIQV